MKTCQNCGTVLADEMQFCTACGNAVVAAAAPVAPAPAPAPAPAYVPPVAPVQTYAPVVEQPVPMSVGGWMARDLIPCIPVVGGIIYLIMLFIWSSDKKKEESFRNWAKSRLIWMAIAVGIGILFGILMVVLGIGMMDVMDEMRYF